MPLSTPASQFLLFGDILQLIQEVVVTETKKISAVTWV
jgi:hypothetical protein